AKALRAGLLQGVLTHGGGDAAALRGLRRHVSAVGDVTAAAALVGAKVIGSDNESGVLGDEDLVTAGKPIGQRLLFREIARQRVGGAFADDGLDDRPDGLSIERGGRTYLHSSPFGNQSARCGSRLSTSHKRSE